MKHNIGIILGIMLLSMGLTACQEQSNIPHPGDNAFNLPFESTVDTSSCTIVTIDEALAIIDSLEAGAQTSELYKISGTVSQNNTSPDDVPGKYSDINLTLKDNSTTKTLACWYTKNLYNSPFTANTQVPLVGSKLTVIGALMNYVDKNGNRKPEMTNGFICRIDSMIAPKPVGPLPDCPEPAEGQISVSQALEIGQALASGGTTTEKYKIVGVVCKIEEAPNTQYKNATFYIQDNTKARFYCYRMKGGSVSLTNPDMLVVGDIVVVETAITNYKGTTIESVANQGNIIQSNNPNYK